MLSEKKENGKPMIRKIYQKVRKPLKKKLLNSGFSIEYISKNPLIIQDRKQPISSSIVENIFEFFDRIPPFYDNNVPVPLQIGGVWRQRLMDLRKKQLQYIANIDKQLDVRSKISIKHKIWYPHQHDDKKRNR
jgi:hypothetical protein